MGGTSNAAGFFLAALDWTAHMFGPQFFIFPPFKQTDHLPKPGQQPFRELFGGGHPLYDQLLSSSELIHLRSECLEQRCFLPCHYLKDDVENPFSLELPDQPFPAPGKRKRSKSIASSRSSSRLSPSPSLLPFFIERERPKGRVVLRETNDHGGNMSQFAGSVLITIPTSQLSWRPFRYESTSNITKPLYEKSSSHDWNPEWLPRRDEVFYVGIHIRQGDITWEREEVQNSCKKAILAKYVPSIYYFKVLETVLPLITHKKPVVIIFSEKSHESQTGSKQSPENQSNQQVVEMVEWLEKNQVEYRKMVGGSAEGLQTFHMMPRVDLLVVGSSGFGRFAASLSLGGIVVALESKSHPLFRLPYVETIVCQGSEFVISPGANVRLMELLTRQRLSHHQNRIQRPERSQR